MENDISVIKNWLGSNESNELFKVLSESVTWYSDLYIINSLETKKIKRKMAYLSEEPAAYRYANFWFPGAIFNSQLIEMKKRIADEFGIMLNSVLLNYYNDGKDEIKWHSDKEDSLGENPIIVCVNLGATRKFWFLDKKSGEKFFHLVENGDLLIMGSNCQEKYLHAILKEKEVKEPRISLTFRYNY